MIEWKVSLSFGIFPDTIFVNFLHKKTCELNISTRVKNEQKLNNVLLTRMTFYKRNLPEFARNILVNVSSKLPFRLITVNK